MKILILANFDVGLYKFRKELIRELLAGENEVVLSLPNGDLVTPLVDLGCHFIDTPVDRRGINPIKDFFLFLKYCKLLKETRPDLAITYTVKPNIYGGMACRFRQVPYAVNITGLGTAFHGKGLLKNLIVGLYRLSCKKAKVIFFENKENQRIFLDCQIVSQEKTCRLNGAGVNLEEYPFTEYPLENKSVHFLFIGRIMKEKGVDELFAAAEQIKRKHPYAEFDIVGPLEENYRDIIKDLEQRDVIHYYGYQADVKPFIERCHCFVLPSYHEGMANTLLEAGAMGRPLITTCIHGCMEAVKDTESGFLCSAGSVRELAETIDRFCCLDEAEKKEMGRLSAEYIRKVFDKRQVVSRTMEELMR